MRKTKPRKLSIVPGVVMFETCPRCEHGHKRLKVKAFTKPPLLRPEEERASARFLGFTTCPRTREPILIAWGFWRRLV